MSANECIFCKIAQGEIPANKVYEDDQIMAFHDLAPQAPVHVLVIPKKHISSLLELGVEDQPLVGHLLYHAQEIARELGLAERGFRVVNNIGEEGGQSVHHIHFHVLGGRKLSWPPG